MRKQLSYVWHFTWLILKYLLLALAAMAVLTIVLVASIYRDLSSAAKAGLAAKEDLTSSLQSAQKQDWSTALVKADQADNEFKSALASLDNAQSKPAIKNLAYINNQISDLQYLLKTGEIVSRLVRQVATPVQALEQITAASPSHKFSDLSEADKSRFLKLVYESQPELNGLKANLDLSIMNLNKIHHIGVLWPVYGKISDIKNELSQASLLVDRASKLVKLMPALAGYPNNSRFLMIMQNNDELRPTGGFIGVYGVMTVHNGQIVSFKADDSYHLDMPAETNKWNLEPPMPISKYLNVKKWYLRDSNWFPDWPTSAKQIKTIYNGESLAINQPVEPFTGLIAINPDLVAQLIKLVGPVTIKDVTYNADNFQPLLQYNVEVAYKDKNISSWDRKEIINELMMEIKNRLYNLPSNSWGEMLSIISNNITTKNIQMYFDNSDWEALAQSLGAGGEIKQDTTSDYLMVVDANLAALKTDSVMKKNITYTVKENKTGLDASVELSYRHEGGVDWRTSRYRTYTRIYAPLGSKFMSLNGLDQTAADFTAEDNKSLNKTVFGFFWTVEPGSDKTISLNYTLPDTIKSQLDNGEYQLLVQKESGQRVEKLQVEVTKQNKRPVRLNSDFSTDKVFTVK